MNHCLSANSSSLQLELWTILKHYFHDISFISVKSLRNMYAGLWEILRAQKVYSLIPWSFVMFLHLLLSGALAVNDNKIHNLCLYSFCEYRSFLHFCCLRNLCQLFLYVIECIDSLLVFRQMGIYSAQSWYFSYIWVKSVGDRPEIWMTACSRLCSAILSCAKAQQNTWVYVYVLYGAGRDVGSCLG